MMKTLLLFFLLSINVSLCVAKNKAKNSKRHKISSIRHQKKYVIEVQDHQTAMKAANPIVDLEDTVRRGINDPLADPRFVMNRINDDFFGKPITETNLHNSELMAFQGGGQMQSPLLGINTNALHNLLPSLPLQQQAAKEQFIQRRPLQTLSNLRNVQRFFTRPNIQRRPSLSDLDMTSNLAQNVAGGLTQGLPGGVAGMLSKGRIASFAKGIPLGTITSQRPLNEKAALLSRVPTGIRQVNRLHRMNNILQRRVPNKQFLQKTIQQQNVNPLTGLPNDLEDRSYGAVSSITSVSDPPPPLPSTITINTAEATQESQTKTHNADIATHHSDNNQNSLRPEPETTTQGSVRSETTLNNLHTDKTSPEDNFSSLKAFLEADNLLREKLAGDGIESVDSPSKSTKSLIHY